MPKIIITVTDEVSATLESLAHRINIHRQYLQLVDEAKDTMDYEHGRIREHADELRDRILSIVRDNVRHDNLELITENSNSQAVNKFSINKEIHNETEER